MEPEFIILHCSDTNDSGTVSWNAIRRYHTLTLGWKDIGYHFGIEIIGTKLVILRGRAPLTEGAHCRYTGMNKNSLGVCVVGKFDDEPPDELTYDVTIDLLSKLSFLFAIPSINIYGHGEVDSRKTCPGKKWDMQMVRNDVHSQVMQRDDIEDAHQIIETSGKIIYWR